MLKLSLTRIVLTVVVFGALAGACVGQAEADADFQKLNQELGQQYAAGKYNGALATAEKIIAAATAQFGKDDLRTALAWKNRGLIENAKGDTAKAEDSLEKAADRYEKHPDMGKAEGASYASTLETLGALKSKNSLLFAEAYFKKALKWREKSNGPESPETGLPLASLANIRFWGREYGKAAELYKRSLVNLAKADSTPAEDLTAVYYRTRCSFRKAKIEDQFEPLKTQYEEMSRTRGIGTPLAKGKPSLINAGVINGKALKLEKPRFPVEARNANADGIVEVDVLIGENGEIISACGANNAHPALVEVSEIAAYNSKFSPTTLASSPVKVFGRIIYNFRR